MGKFVKEIDYSEEQKLLFHEIRSMTFGLNQLASFVQNDFSRLLEDGRIKKDDILSAKEEFKKKSKEFSAKFEEISKRTIKLLEHYSK